MANKKYHTWTPEEIEYIKNNLTLENVKEIASKFNVSINSIHGISKKNNFAISGLSTIAEKEIKRSGTPQYNKASNWTKEQDDILKKMFQNNSSKKIGDHLNKTPKDVRNRATYLGLKKVKYFWTPEDENMILNSALSESELARILGRSKWAIYAKKRELKKVPVPKNA